MMAWKRMAMIKRWDHRKGLEGDGDTGRSDDAWEERWGEMLGTKEGRCAQVYLYPQL
jgi:hypothetical protein